VTATAVAKRRNAKTANRCATKIKTAARTTRKRARTTKGTREKRQQVRQKWIILE